MKREGGADGCIPYHTIPVKMEEDGTNLSGVFHSTPAAVPAALELVSLFSHGFETSITVDNVVPLVCVLHHLGMADAHNNLFKSAATFFQSTVLPSWSNTIRALRTSNPFLHQATHLGLLSVCFDSISSILINNSHALCQPSILSTDGRKITARRKLFPVDSFDLHDLTLVPLEIYLLLIRALAERHVPPLLISTSIAQYLTKWAFSKTEEAQPSCDSIAKKEVVEAMEKLMPIEDGLFPTKILCQFGHLALLVRADSECLQKVEERIGKQLDDATVEDLMLVLRSNKEYKKKEPFTERLRSILKNFYMNYGREDASGIVKVAELMEKILGEVAAEEGVEAKEFTAVAEMAAAASLEINRRCDEIYTAVDKYLEKNGWLTEGESEMVCSVLDGGRMSREACMHAAQNSRLPTRVLMRILLATHVWLREAVEGGEEVRRSSDSLCRDGEEEEEEEEEDVMAAEMERMGRKVGELEEECGVVRREISSVKGKWDVWGAVKRKLGCSGTNVVLIDNSTTTRVGWNGNGNGKKMMKKRRRLLYPPPLP